MSRLGFRASSVIAGFALCVGGAIGTAPAVAQIKPAMVRSVDEPARVPYGGTVAMNCPFSNQCIATFPVVPAGKRVRITKLSLAMPAQSAAVHFLAVFRNSASSNGFLAVFPVTPISGAYYGNLLATTQSLDLIYEAGESPVVELGVSSGTGGLNAGAAHVTLSGYIVDTTP